MTKLSTLIVSKNKLSTVEDVAHLAEVPSLSCVDMQKNSIDDPAVLEVLDKIKDLRVLYLMGNPVVKKIKNYRWVFEVLDLLGGGGGVIDRSRDRLGQRDRLTDCPTSNPLLQQTHHCTLQNADLPRRELELSRLSVSLSLSLSVSLSLSLSFFLSFCLSV